MTQIITCQHSGVGTLGTKVGLLVDMIVIILNLESKRMNLGLILHPSSLIHIRSGSGLITEHIN